MELDTTTYNISYRNIRYPRIELKTGRLLLVLPFDCDPDKILKRHKDWIVRKTEFVKECLKHSSDKKIVERTDEEFKKLVHSFVRRFSKQLGVQLNRIYFKKMKTKWASCSSKKSITINTLLKHLPANLLKYVIFHEVAHLIERKHSMKFWNIIEKRFRDVSIKEKELMIYWFLLQDKFLKKYILK